MPDIHAEPLRRLVSAIFARAGSAPDEVALIARRLVDANLVGHDSHGILLVPAYLPPASATAAQNQIALAQCDLIGGVAAQARSRGSVVATSSS